jgi:hypothetical protein
LGHNDPLTLSLNHVRPRAVAILIRYAAQLARNDRKQTADSQSNDELHTMRRGGQLQDMLTTKLDVGQEPSWAVRSVFGQHLQTLFWLDREWTIQNLDRILPESDNQTDIRMFIAAWDGFVVGSRYFPSQDLLTFLHPKYQRAIDNLGTGQVTKGLDPAHKLADHVIHEYLHGSYVLTTEPDSTDLAVRFYQKAPLDARNQAARAAWRACIQNPRSFWPRILALWEWRVTCVVASSEPQDFAAEMAYFAQLPNTVRDFIPLPSISSLLLATLQLPHLSSQPGLKWISVEEYLAKRVQYEPVDVAKFMAWLIDLAPIPQSSAFIETRRSMLEALAANEQTRVIALDLIDRLGRRGTHRYRDIYQRYA